MEMESPAKCSSFKNLVGTIESLLGSKSDLTVTWAQSVKLIIEDLSNSYPSTPCTPSFPEGTICTGASDKSSLEGELILLKAAYALSNVNRKLALNKLLDLKGHIRVFCRVRPFLANEHQPGSPDIVGTDVPNEVNISSGKARSFKFDKVFQPSSLQDDVFSEVEPMIRSALDGSNVCIFAYGQTGTGKTFTMEGNNECPGIVPRTLQQLFFDASLDTTMSYSFKLSMLEVYRGSLRDLLAPKQQQQQASSKSLCIQMTSSGCTEIENLTEIPMKSASQARYLYLKGVRSRSTCWTTANESSSRSHCLVRISITCSYGKHSNASKLWLVDLGGSERFFKTQAQGQTLEEGKAINSSLSALGDVISALQRKQAHIPYRNSKLTQILRDSLGKDSKALMLVHVSPREEDLGETLCSLGFASRARGIHLGKDLSATAKVERTAVMADVFKKMKLYEDECSKLNDNIQMIESLIQPSRRLGEKQDEEPVSRLTSCQTAKKLCSTPASVPRFMTPTQSSERKKRIQQAELHHQKVVSVVMETTEKRVLNPGSETRQVRRTLNFRVVDSDSQSKQEIKEISLVKTDTHERSNTGRVISSSRAERKNVRGSTARRCGWEDFGKKKKDSGKRQRWMLECSSRISITKRF